MDAIFEPGELVSLRDVGRLVRPDRPLHISTVYRWWQRGVRGQRLATVVVGGQRFVREGDLRAFLASLNEPGAIPATPTAAAERAGAELERMGA